MDGISGTKEKGTGEAEFASDPQCLPGEEGSGMGFRGRRRQAEGQRVRSGEGLTVSGARKELSSSKAVVK